MANPLLSAGDPAPDFSLPAADDRDISLADLSGKYVILYFYPKDDTPGCTKEACDFRDALEALSSANTVVLGVSADTLASHEKFKAKYDLNFDLLSDRDKAVMNAAWRVPGEVDVREDGDGRGALHLPDRPGRHAPRGVGQGHGPPEEEGRDRHDTSTPCAQRSKRTRERSGWPVTLDTASRGTKLAAAPAIGQPRSLPAPLSSLWRPATSSRASHLRTVR